MADYSQANWPITMKPPSAGAGELLPVGFIGQETISSLFHFHLDCIAENNRAIAFDKWLGQKVTVAMKMPNNQRRFFNGICSRIGQGERDTDFTSYRVELVPQFWLLTKRAQSRIFQHMSVPDILKKVLQGLDVSFDDIRGTFYPRDFCVQYRETDFNFASRLMEEEGIFYFFKHADGSHKLVLANTPAGHPALPGGKIIYEDVAGGGRPEDRICDWSKTQEIRSGKYVLWDHCFELPHKHLEADTKIQENATLGTVEHKLKVANNDKLEIYDWPGEYAQRFDGVDKGGGDRHADIQKIFEDNKRTVAIRMQEEALGSLLVQGAGTCRQLTAGHKFTLDRHFNANGDYVLTSVSHSARLDPRAGGNVPFHYYNTFTCIPAALPFRPPRTTPKPVVPGSQTAVVVGPPGEEIFTDKYGRVKVQFHWDREGQYNADSSCWVRVAQIWAGKRWGASFWPRIGQEVVVDFLEGDPDQPIIVGSVYNADQMPPYLGNGLDSKHANDNKVCGVKSNTTMGGKGYNEWRFDDTKDKEQIFIHAEKDIDIRVKNDRREWIGNDRSLHVMHDKKEEVHNDKHIYIHKNHSEHIGGNMELLIDGSQDIVVSGDKKELIEGNDHFHVNGSRNAKIDGNQDLTVTGNQKELVEGSDHFHVNGNRNAQVDGNQDLTVNGTQTSLVGGDDHLQVRGNRLAAVSGTDDLLVSGDQRIKVNGTRNVAVNADQKSQVAGGVSFTIGGDYQEKAGGKHAVEAAQEIHLKAGMKVILEAGMQLTIKGPGGFVDIGPAGVTIQGVMVKINSGGAAGTGSGAKPAAPASAKAAKQAKAPEDAQPPEDAKEAEPKAPAAADDSKSGHKSAPG